MSEEKLETYFFTVLIVAVLILVGVIFYPFLGALAVAVVLATLCMPLYDRLLSRLHKEGLSALIVVLLVLFVIVAPAVGLFMLLLDEVSGISRHADTFDFGTMPAYFEALRVRVLEFLPFLGTIDFAQAFHSITQKFGDIAALFLASTVSFLFETFVAIIALFYLLKDGHRFVSNLIKLSPLSDDEDVQIVKKLNTVTHSLIRGSLVVALMQGVLSGLGFLLFGVPNPILWGSFAAIGALIPTLGTSIVAIPAIGYLFFTGQTVAAFGLLAWSIMFVGLIDNILGPKLIGKGARIHPLFVLLSVLGGISVFGLVGFLLGPLVFGLLLSLFEIYKVKIGQLHAEATT